MSVNIKVEQAIIKAVMLLRERAPKDTRNLAYNAINWKREGVNKWSISVNENIAPYMVYTNEPWISESWKGKSNPNEGWWESASKEAMDIIAKELNTKVKESK